MRFHPKTFHTKQQKLKGLDCGIPAAKPNGRLLSTPHLSQQFICHGKLNADHDDLLYPLLVLDPCFGQHCPNYGSKRHGIISGHFKGFGQCVPNLGH